MSVSLNPAHSNNLSYPCSSAVLQVQEGLGDWNCIHFDGNIRRKVVLQNPNAPPPHLDFTKARIAIRCSRPVVRVYTSLPIRHSAPPSESSDCCVKELLLFGYADKSIALFVKFTRGSHDNTEIKSYFKHHNLSFSPFGSDTIIAKSYLEMKALFQIVSCNNEIPQEAATLISEIIESSPCDPVPEKGSDSSYSVDSDGCSPISESDSDASSWSSSHSTDLDIY